MPREIISAMRFTRSTSVTDFSSHVSTRPACLCLNVATLKTSAARSDGFPLSICREHYRAFHSPREGGQILDVVRLELLNDVIVGVETTLALECCLPLVARPPRWFGHALGASAGR
jgi:hypothetical protein